MTFRRLYPAFLAFSLVCVASCAETTVEAVPCAVSVAFGRNCESALIEAIGAAEEEILVAVYSLTRKSITSALVDAAKRGVSVTVKYDANSHEWRGMKQAIGFLRRRKVRCIAVELPGEYAKMHHKFSVIDGKRVLTGSFNYTTTASTVNYENLVLLESPAVAAEFAAEFRSIVSRSQEAE